MTSHAFVEDMMEKNRSGELRSPSSQHLGTELVDFSRGAGGRDDDPGRR